MFVVVKVLVIWIILSQKCYINAVFASDFNMTNYYKMPPIYQMDDFDRCMEEYPNQKSVYCYTRSQIKPNDSSSLWSLIKEFSDNKKRHFRHDRLNRGVCINWCKPHFKDYIRPAKMRYYTKLFDNSSEISFDPNSFSTGLDDQIRYNKIINLCVNWDLKHTYNLLAYSTVEYCITNKDTRETDSVDFAFSIIFFVILKLIISSSLYDFHLKRKNLQHIQSSEHYKIPVDGKFAAVMVSFSLPRNWYRLVSEPNSEISHDLRPINAIRFLTMYCVMVGHCVLFMNVLPQMNPQYMERNYYRLLTQLLINGATVIQTFFAISGYLLSVQFMKLRKSTKFQISFFWKSILYRYLRIMPVYAFIMLFHSTWLITLQDGPLWPHLADTEKTFCRKNWWTNVFFINNIVGVSEPCVQHGWYLAADFQMFIIGVILHLIFWKFPRCTKFVLSLGILISYVIPGILTYANKFEGVFMATPENERYGHWYDEMYKKMYIPSYTNFGSFLCGMIGGILFYKYKQEHNDLKQFKTLVIIWYSAVPISLTMLMSGYIFYHYDFNKPTFWIAFYSSLLKNLWGLLGAAVITGMAFGIGWIVKDMMCHPIFRPLGRMTFCAYLIHPAIIRILMGNLRQPIYSSDISVLNNVMSAFLLSYMVAFLLCICIEYPVSSLLRQFAGKEIETVDSIKHKNVNTIELIRRIEE